MTSVALGDIYGTSCGLRSWQFSSLLADFYNCSTSERLQEGHRMVTGWSPKDDRVEQLAFLLMSRLRPGCDSKKQTIRILSEFQKELSACKSQTESFSNIQQR